MNKIFVLFTSAALLLAGCQKSENVSQSQVNGGDGDFTFSVSVPDVSTKAVADGDGAAANVDQWVMEVLDADGDRYNYQRENGEKGVLTHSFTVRLVKGQKYTVLFWADTKDAYNVDSLEVVKLVNQTTYSANLDSRDAFSAVVYDFQTTQATAETVTLKRAVSQMNIIFTDLKDLYETMGSASEYGKFKPVNFKAEAKIPTTFNVKTQKAGAPATTALTITADGDYLNNYNTHREKETLFMDYFFSSASEKDLVDIDFSFTSKGVDIKHSFTSIPFQRNYRTNIIGEFMSSNATWNVTVDPDWSSGAQGEDDIVYEVVNNIANANEVIAKEINAGKKEINVKFNSEPDDAGTPGTEGAKAIVTTNLPEDGVLNVQVETDTKILYIGDYTSETSEEVATSGLKDAMVNVNVPEGKTIKKLVVNAPSKTVYINGAQVASAGTIEEIDAITSDNTLVVEAGQTINKLIFRQGALKIYGTVVAVEIPEGHGTIYVRDCEGLSQGVYSVLEPYIDVNNGYAGVQDGVKWNIVKGAAPYVAQIGDNCYYSFGAAIAAAQANDVITVLKNCETGSTYTMSNCLALTAEGSTLDLNGKTLTVTNNFSFFIAANNITVKNGTVAAGANSDKVCGYNSYAMIAGAKTKSTSVSGIVLKDLTTKGGLGFGGAVGESEYEGSCVATIENCTVTTGDFAAIYAQSNSSVTVLSGSYTQTPKSLANTEIIVNEEGSSVVVKGGTYNADPTKWVHEDYKVTENEGLWTVTEKEPVAKIGETTYTSFEKALAAAKANDEITILANCTIASQITLDKNLSFDLNDKTLSFNISGVRALVLNNNSEISFKDGNLAIANSNSLGLFDVTNCKSLSLTSVNITGNTSDANGKSGFIFQGDNGACAVTLTDCYGTTNYRIYRGQGSNSTLTVTNGEYNCGGYNVAFQDAGTATYNNVKITVDGAGASDYQSCIYVSGKTAEINNCTISSPKSKNGAITVCMEGTATINGGTYSGKIAVDVLYSGGVVNINGGTYTSVGGDDSYTLYADSRQAGNSYIGTDKTAHIIVNSGTVTGGIGLQHQARVYVHGGTINGSVTRIGDAKPIYADGGIFSFDPTTATLESKQVVEIPTGYIAQAQGTDPETWKVMLDPFAGKVAKIGEVGYASFADAVNAVKANETITLLENTSVPSNYTTGSPLSITKSGVTIDLNNKTLTVVNNVAFVIKGSNNIVKNGIVKAGDRDNATYKYQSYALKIIDASGVVFDGLTMTGGINSSNSTCQIQNCTVTAGEWAAVCAQNSSSITIKSGTYKGFPTGGSNCRSLYLLTGGKIYVEGGDFIGCLITDNNANNKFEFSGGTIESIQKSTFDNSYLKSGYSANTSSQQISGVWHYYTTVTKN